MNTLIIKGHMAAAETALRVKGIKFVSLRPHPKFKECIATVTPDTSWETLAMWFCEPKECGDDGFPDGTLLWYGPAYKRIVPIKWEN